MKQTKGRKETEGKTKRVKAGHAASTGDEEKTA
jgi:hypothetical protein